jgi:outer membrane biosynthesis protein TonB
MNRRPVHRLVRATSAAAIALALAACTQGGQFDPTEVLSADVFGTKKKLQGEREPLFPNGVPGAESGVPRDLVKGYQAPPEQATAENADTTTNPPAQAAEAKPKPKPKPRPKVAHAPAAAPAGQNAVWGQSSAAPSQPQRRDPAWDQKSASPQQSAWPGPQPAASAQQTAQPTQSIWPNPQAPNTYSR